MNKLFIVAGPSKSHPGVTTMLEINGLTWRESGCSAAKAVYARSVVCSRLPEVLLEEPQVLLTSWSGSAEWTVKMALVKLTTAAPLARSRNFTSQEKAKVRRAKGFATELPSSLCAEYYSSGYAYAWGAEVRIRNFVRSRSSEALRHV